MVCLALFLAGIIYAYLPGQMDSYAYYIQAKIFASGQWFAESHKLPEFFGTQWFVNDGKYYSQYPPGHSLLLAAMFFFGAPWFLSPLLAGTGMVLIYYLGKEIGNVRIARIATFLTLFSPVVMFMSAEYMSHMTAWVFTTGFALFYIRAHRYGRTMDAVIAGTLFGYLFVTRPQVCAALAIPFGLHWLCPWPKPARSFWKCGLSMGAMFLCGIAFFLYYNLQTTGELWVTPYEKYQSYDHFKTVLTLPLLYNIHRVAMQTEYLHLRLFGWPFSSLMFVWLLFQARLQKPYATLLVTGCLFIVASLIFIPYTGGIYQPRYLFEISGFLAVLTAMGIDRLVLWLKLRVIKDWPMAVVRMTVYAYVIILTACSYPTVASMYRELMEKNWPDRSYPEVYYMLDEKVKKPGLVFIRDNYYMGSLFNPPTDDAPIIAARDHGDQNTKLMQLYPRRFVYSTDGRDLKLIREPVPR